MRIVDRYVFKTVLGSTAIVLLVLLVLEVFFSLVSELEDLGDGGYGLTQVLLYVTFRLPGMIYQTLPMALLVGGLLGVGGLAAGNELVALRAAGLSTARFLVGAIAAAVIVGALAMVIGETLAPAAERLGRQLRAEAKGLGVVQDDGGGFWARTGRSVVRVGAVLADRSLADITFFTLGEQNRLEVTRSARQARFSDGRWTLIDVSESRLSAIDIGTKTYRQLDWQTELTPDTLDLLAAKPEHMAVRELAGYIRYLRDNSLDASHYELAYWLKVIAPLTNVTMLLVGLPFALGRSRQAGAGQRLLIGVLLGLLFVLLNRLLGNWVLLSGVPPIIGAFAPSGLFLVIALIGLHRSR